MVATEQQNRGRHYQRRFCSKGKFLSNHYFCWSSFCFFGSVIIFLSSFLPASQRRPFKMCLIHRKQQRSLTGSTAWTWHCQATPSWVCILPTTHGPNSQWNHHITRWHVIPFPCLFCPQGGWLCLVLAYSNTSLTPMSLYNKVRRQAPEARFLAPTHRQ